MLLVKVRGAESLYNVRSGTWRLSHHDVQDTTCYNLRYRYPRVMGPLGAARVCLVAGLRRTPVDGIAMDR